MRLGDVLERYRFPQLLSVHCRLLLYVWSSCLPELRCWEVYGFVLESVLHCLRQQFVFYRRSIGVQFLFGGVRAERLVERVHGVPFRAVFGCSILFLYQLFGW